MYKVYACKKINFFCFHLNSYLNIKGYFNLILKLKEKNNFNKAQILKFENELFS